MTKIHVKHLPSDYHEGGMPSILTPDSIRFGSSALELAAQMTADQEAKWGEQRVPQD